MDKLTFYFDRNFGRRLPEALFRADAPFNVEFHHSERNRFPQNITDDEWLSVVGQKGWFAFSHDRKWHENAPELAAILQHKIGCFYLWGAQANTWEKVRFFVRHSANIIKLAQTTPRPFLYYVTKNGRVERMNIDDAEVFAGAATLPARAVRAVHAGGKGTRGR